jgi:hypothetical protein
MEFSYWDLGLTFAGFAGSHRDWRWSLKPTKH